MIRIIKSEKLLGILFLSIINKQTDQEKENEEGKLCQFGMSIKNGPDMKA